MITVSGLVTSDTASLAASSGRHRITASAPFSISARASRSLRLSGSIETSCKSVRASRRSRICRPVVPASRSMKTLGKTLGALAMGGLRSEQNKEKDQEKGRFGAPKRPLPNAYEPRLALRELEAAAGLGLAVLLTLDDAAVAGQEAVRLHDRAQAGLVVGQGLRQAVTDGAGLARQARAFHGHDDVELTEAIGHFQRLGDHHSQHRTGEIDFLVTTVDRDRALARLDPDASDRVLALAGRVGAALDRKSVV